MFTGIHTEETKQKISKALMGGTRNNKGERNPMFGRYHSEEAKIRMRKLHKCFSKEGCKNVSKAQRKRVSKSSYVNPFYGKYHNEETKRKIGLWGLGRKFTEESKRKMSRAKIKQWQNLEYKERQLRASRLGLKSPTKPEKYLGKLLGRLFPGEYKYVGNGKIWIDGKNPDFINVNGQKKLIEMFGDYWHSKIRTGLPKKEHRKQRQKHFAEYGYKTCVVWEKQLLNRVCLEKKLRKFHKE